MKKLLIICLMLVCALGLTACGQEKQEQAPKAEPATAVFNTSMGDLRLSWQQIMHRKRQRTLLHWRKRAFITALPFTA